MSPPCIFILILPLQPSLVKYVPCPVSSPLVRPLLSYMHSSFFATQSSKTTKSSKSGKAFAKTAKSRKGKSSKTYRLFDNGHLHSSQAVSFQKSGSEFSAVGLPPDDEDEEADISGSSLLGVESRGLFAALLVLCVGTILF